MGKPPDGSVRLSAEGLSYAFRSPLALAKTYKENRADVLAGYRKNTGKLRTNIFIKNRKAPFMFHEGLRNLALRSGLLSIKIEE
jgi:hypothetical protein